MWNRPTRRSLVGLIGGLSLAVGGLLVVQQLQTSAAPAEIDTTLVPISACRLMDTRPVPNRVGTIGTFSADDTNVISAHGVQGNCVIPTDAVGLALNVTALNATAPTYLTVWPEGDRPATSNLNPGPGQRPTPNAVVTPLTGAGTFDIYNRAGNVDVIIDINGYYIDAARAFGQPYAVTAVTRKYAIEEGEFGYGDHVVVSVHVTAPVDGQVTVHSATSVRADHSPAGISCWITTEAPGLEQDDLVQTWTPGVADAASTLAGVRLFDLSEGTTRGYHLNCNKPDREGSLTLTDSVLTATFTPAPAS